MSLLVYQRTIFYIVIQLVIQLLVHSIELVRVQREVVVVIVHDDCSSVKKSPLLLLKVVKMLLVLISADDSRVATLDTPHA